MKPLAQFIMRGRLPAALVVFASAVLSVLIPLIGLISGAAVALVTLRNGAREGSTAIVLALGASTLFFALVLGSPWPAVGLLLALWAPVWGLALVLRATRSLSLTVLAAGVGGLLLVLLAHLFLDDPASYWLQLLEPLRQVLEAEGAVEATAGEDLFARIARWMTGAFAAALLLQIVLGVFIGRWWQALLYNPGGFGAEFRDLRLPRALGALGLLLLAVIAFAPGPGLVVDLLIALAPLFLLQGLAVVHQLLHARGAHAGWLVGLYGLMVLLMPHAELLVACVGLVDIWVDVRARTAARPPG